jgi:hypothetical protein
MKMVAWAVLALGFAGMTSGAQAHEIWIEHAGTGPARIYLGEPEHPLHPGGDPAFPSLKAPKLIPASTAPQVRGAGFIEVAVPAGDVRAWDDNLFAPWDEEGKRAGGIYYARAGRAETRALMAAEIVPTEAHGTRFVLMKDGKPHADAPVRLLTPDRWMKVVKTDAAGSFTVPIRESGRYILQAEMKDTRDTELPGGKVAILNRITTTSFVVP